MNTLSTARSRFPARLAISAGLVTTGVVHTQLYGRGYRYIDYVGPSFAIQAAAAFALAALVLVGPWSLRAAAAVLSAASLAGFVLSRTSGLFGFTETGWQPAPQAMVAVVAEIVTLVVCLVSLYRSELRT
ncbi:hypothetical protein A5780_11830 [Nocardia sp. 852002-20019_SCH5090214]|jgi:hypothetical protein|uniref:DoxX family protein n=1 Tax=Nocardia nova TaxID=37330 RepID=A0A2S6A902_9NOCA|nr:MULTISPECIES: hypothetical protein [Nocardia]MBV7704349.1 hypothetical protein [Nocardia nova]OBA67117.1 hypothetical protein A5780_11830 [Nocardia sp. 852002-20019_SCH5090214]PPI98410.1 hypothetical protein C5E46_12295 [Nocardia nova]PPJ09882.1 hypothetical protein C5E51_11415 [Nocardia nova]PPJ29743.1 hypothetical protein C5F51_09560 [Nocardia nova]